jgi:hypothetical protein
MGLSLLAQASMPLKFWDEAFLAATFLINRTPSKVISYASPLVYSVSNLSTRLYEFSAVHVGLISDPIININFSFGQRNVSSLAIIIFTKVSNVLMFPLVVSTSPAMLSLMKTFFPSLNCILMLVLDRNLTFFSSLSTCDHPGTNL